ncbi:MAG: hypothetical protein QG657_799 [Acidobacteriota bacterium]|nr:hypothetical protein [Acidobacteriota bacterium]
MEQAIDRELPIKSAYIGPFPLENVNKPRAERCMNYTLGSHNLGFALDSDFICGKPMEVEKITNGKKDFWKKYDMVIILNFPTMFHFNRDNWYYDFDLPEQIRESNPAVKIGIHTEGWPTHFMSVYDPLLVGNVIRWLENADFIISTERKVDTSAYKAFNKRVYYLPYPVPQKICCSDGQTRRITDCRIADHQRENIVAV